MTTEKTQLIKRTELLYRKYLRAERKQGFETTLDREVRDGLSGEVGRS